MPAFSSYFSKLTELSLFSEFRFQDALDIIVLSFLVYRLILLIQGTRTMYILYGMLFMILIALVASEMQLVGVKLLFNSFLSSIVVIIVVLFQSDLRNALARIGRRQFQRNHAVDIDEFCQIFEKSIQQLSQNRIGALIVFERSMDIKNMQHGGIEMNAIASVPLIVSLFDKNIPVHDGAMIINHKKQIKMVSAILPLTINIEMRVDYGTRHRAAIGISEETDAIAIVVSEQTGIISYTNSGKIQSIELSQLRSILRKTVK